VNNHLDYTFNEFVQTFCKQHYKVQTNGQVYMNLCNVKQNLDD
jgi:hypothetical protein